MVLFKVLVDLRLGGLTLGDDLHVIPVQEIRYGDGDLHVVQTRLIQSRDIGIDIQALQTRLAVSGEVEEEGVEECPADQVGKRELTVVLCLDIAILIQGYYGLGEQMHTGVRTCAAGSQFDESQTRQELQVFHIQGCAACDPGIVDQDGESLRSGETVEIDDPFKSGLNRDLGIYGGCGAHLQHIAQVESQIDGQVIEAEEVDLVRADMTLADHPHIHQI